MSDDKLIAGDELEVAIEELGIDLGKLVSMTGVWANPETFRHLRKIHDDGTWHPNCRRYQQAKGEKRREIVDGIKLDDNTFANAAIKEAVGYARKDVVGYHVSHVWPLTCYDHRYHTCIANLVLLPAPIAGLSDYDSGIEEILKFRAYDLFGWHPGKEQPPQRPINYPDGKFWRPPPAFTEGVKKKLNRLATKVAVRG